MEITQFVYSPVDGHLSGFQFLPIINKAAMNITVQVQVETNVFIYLG